MELALSMMKRAVNSAGDLKSDANITGKWAKAINPSMQMLSTPEATRVLHASEIYIKCCGNICGSPKRRVEDGNFVRLSW